MDARYELSEKPSAIWLERFLTPCAYVPILTLISTICVHMTWKLQNTYFISRYICSLEHARRYVYLNKLFTKKWDKAWPVRNPDWPVKFRMSLAVFRFWRSCVTHTVYSTARTMSYATQYETVLEFRMCLRAKACHSSIVTRYPSLYLCDRANKKKKIT